jgi:hypothetical protein
MPLPADGVSYLLPEGQKYQHMLVYEDGTVTLFDYIEQEVTEDGSGVIAQVDLNLGKYRICLLREVDR